MLSFKDQSPSHFYLYRLFTIRMLMTLHVIKMRDPGGRTEWQACCAVNALSLSCHKGVMIDAIRPLAMYRKGSHGSGQWALPGGKLDFNETLEICAARELQEETGVQIPDEAFQRTWVTSTVFDATTHYVTVFMQAELPEVMSCHEIFMMCYSSCGTIIKVAALFREHICPIESDIKDDELRMHL